MFHTGSARRAVITKAARCYRSPPAADSLVPGRGGSSCRVLSIFMRIAVDVMGGDHGCGVVIEGARRALQADRRIDALYLVGNQSAIHAALPARGFRDHRMRVVHAAEVLTMEDKPATAVRKKK